MDVYGRKVARLRVLSWRTSNSMEAVFCVDCLEDALRIHGKPEIFNLDSSAPCKGAVCPAGAKPARPLSLRPEATGAVVEATKRLKPLV